VLSSGSRVQRARRCRAVRPRAVPRGRARGSRRSVGAHALGRAARGLRTAYRRWRAPFPPPGVRADPRPRADLARDASLVTAAGADAAAATQVSVKAPGAPASGAAAPGGCLAP